MGDGSESDNGDGVFVRGNNPHYLEVVMRFDFYPEVPEGAVLFDFDYESSFDGLGIDIDANFSTASSYSTHIIGTSSRVRSSNFYEFEYVEGGHLFSSKNKNISEEGEMVLIKNDDGSVYLVDYLDSYRMSSGDVINGVMLRYREVSPQITPEPTPDPEPTPEPGIYFDFDYHTEFKDLDIGVDAGMSTGSSDSTWIYGNTARIKSDDYQGFLYDQKSHDFSTRNKLILEDGEMALVQNANGDVYLVDWIDSQRNYEDGVDGVRLRYRNVHTAEMPTPEPEPTAEPEPTPEPQPELDVTGDGNNVIEGDDNTIINIVDNSVTNNVDNSVTNVDNSTTVVNIIDNSVANTDNSTNTASSETNVDNSIKETVNNVDNSVNTVDNSTNVTIESLTNIYNGFTMEKFPVDLSEVIKGQGKKSDLVEGSTKDDVIGFGQGRDRLIGDRGEDVFVFSRKDKFGRKGADRIIDFNPVKDQLLVGNKALRGIGKDPEFATASNRKEMNTLKREDMELVYFEPKGQLYYNHNDEGRGFGKKGGLFAVLNGSPELTEESIGLMGN